MSMVMGIKKMVWAQAAACMKVTLVQTANLTLLYALNHRPSCNSQLLKMLQL